MTSDVEIFRGTRRVPESRRKHQAMTRSGMDRSDGRARINQSPAQVRGNGDLQLQADHNHKMAKTRHEIPAILYHTEEA
ncbi:hypothetical protein RB195_016138 [Necator americanus]|uniref:Uncharacterized protein n=2 Tax=Necator americanus TaxID=51031 RepID=W2T5R3_NECAM|nr:hypothetical protein NECAME_11134 [Necator americanus]ETN77350.1 hypothetical protein NECAME_11134 [Necator americanus]